jgi:hypothetical protein
MNFDDKPIREIDETSKSAAEDRFEEILKKVKAAGAEIVLDEEGPLYLSLGMDDFEIGRQRTVEFSLNGTDFHISRQEKNSRIVGSGVHKSLEELPRPFIDIKLKSKPGISDQWVYVDLEDVF